MKPRRSYARTSAQSAAIREHTACPGSRKLLTRNGLPWRAIAPASSVLSTAAAREGSWFSEVVDCFELFRGQHDLKPQVRSRSDVIGARLLALRLEGRQRRTARASGILRYANSFRAEERVLGQRCGEGCSSRKPR
jgi:hypothetical protein